MVKDDKKNEGLVDEQEDLSRVLDYYEKRFKESIGIMPAVVETEEMEMDLIVGMDSDQVLGMRLFQFGPAQDDEDGEDGGEEKGDETAAKHPAIDIKAKTKDPAIKTKAGDDEDEDEDDGEEIDDEVLDVLVYDFTRAEASKAKLKGESILEVEVGAPECEDNDEAEEPVKQSKPAAAKPAPPKPAAAKPGPAKPEGEHEEKYWVHIAVYMEEDSEGAELTGAMLHYIDKPKVKIPFLPNPDLN
jgi:hypothetical protein